MLLENVVSPGLGRVTAALGADLHGGSRPRRRRLRMRQSV